MQNKIKVSIIMPVLNGMPYFPQAFDSVLTQSLTEIEIIVVDAGSTDGTVSYVEAAMKKDPRVKLIQSDMKSHGRQCNLGIDAAIGEYIGFCESDDFLEPSMYEDLVGLAKQNPKAQVIHSEFFMTFGEGENQQNYHQSLLSSKHQDRYHKSVTYEDLPELQYGLIYMWHSIYQKEFLEKHQIRLQETAGASFQDVGFVEQVKLQAETMIFTDKAYYHYRRDNPNSSFYKKNVGLFEAQELLFAMKTYLQKETKHPSRRYQIFIRIFFIFTHHYRLDRLLCDDISYEKEIAHLQKKVREFHEKAELSQQFSVDDEFFWIFLRDLDLYRKVIDEKDQLKLKLIETLLDKVKEEKTVVLFGFGESGRNYKFLLEKKCPEKTVICCDNNEKLRVNGVLSPVTVVKENKEVLYLLTVEGAFVPMREQLVSLGIPSEQILKLPLLSLQEVETW